MEKPPQISLFRHKAVIFDLDGVLTRTADVHAGAWKRMFDEFLQGRTEKQAPFDAEHDYLTYVDGKPRLKGIESFLLSRGIQLSEGAPDDSEEAQTLWGLGNKKNKMFNRELDEKGVEVFDTTVALIRSLRKKGIRSGLISSSKNCRPILKKTRLTSLFDVIIDGTDAVRLALHGKPAPDVFIEAAKALGVKPQEAVVVEDAISGVQAGRAGKFDLVIGVDRANQAQALLENGADVVVKDLGEVSITGSFPEIPNALDSLKKITSILDKKEAIIFLDYDGTLTPIVERPELAKLSEKMRKTIEELAKRYKIAVISGRDRPDVEKMAKLEGIFYAGSHGFDIKGPNGQHFENEEGKTFLSTLEEAEKELREQIPAIKGAWVERKRYAIAVHFRQADSKQEPEVEKIVDQVHSHHYKLRKKTGKKIFELQPDIEWDKGKALFWLMELFNIDLKKTVPIYLGDDTTDEDAFLAIQDVGIGICVQDDRRLTFAHYLLKDTSQVEELFKRLIHG